MGLKMPSDVIRDLMVINQELRQVLKTHHQWHQDIGVVKLVHGDGEETELDLSAEFCDSDLCDKTMEALAFEP